MNTREQRSSVTFPLKGGENVTLRCFGVFRKMLRKHEVAMGFWGSETSHNKTHNNHVSQPCFAGSVMSQNSPFVESSGDCQLWTKPPGDPFLSLFCGIAKNVPQKPKLTATSGNPEIKRVPF